MPLFRRKTAEKQTKPPLPVQNYPGSDLRRTSSVRSNKSLPRSPSSPDSWEGANDLGLLNSAINGSLPGEKRPKTLVLTDLVLQDSQDVPADSLESPLRTSSRLSKTLLEVVRDKDALACLKSFLSSRKSEHLIQFWCDAESFHAATLTRLRTHARNRKSSGTKSRSNSFRLSEPSLQSEEKTLNVSPDFSADTTLPGNSSHRDNIRLQHVQIFPDSAFHEAAMGKSQNRPDEVLGTSFLPSDSSCPPAVSYHQHKSDQTKGTTQINTCVPARVPALHPHVPEPSSTLSSSSVPVCEADKPVIVTTLNFPISPQSSSNPSMSINCSDSSSADTVSQPAVLSQQASPNVGGELENPRSPVEPSQEDIAQRLKKSIERDAVLIFSTYIAKDAPQPILVNDRLRSEVISKICKEDGEVDPECFVGCQRFVLNRLETEYFQSFRDSEFYCRHQVNVLTTERVYLPDILLNENALCYFMEYMEQEGASDLMQMWLAADNFQKQLMAAAGSYDGEQAQNDAMVIYDRYFSLQATNPIGFDDKMRFEIEGNICREGGPLPDCFTKAKNIVLTILEKVYFPGYMQGHIYYRYLSDLLSTVQVSEDMPSRQYQKGHRRTESDASSEHSAGSQSTGAESVVSRNTLLAVDTRKLHKGKTIEGDFHMSMDMFNPDVLWKRPEANNLSLGCVNELGQFVSLFEHGSDADKKKGPVLFKKRKEKEKEEEEMALRIARMIISDVNTMTKTGENMSDQHKS